MLMMKNVAESVSGPTQKRKRKRPDRQAAGKRGPQGKEGSAKRKQAAAARLAEELPNSEVVADADDLFFNYR
jgi:ribosomal protein L15